MRAPCGSAVATEKVRSERDLRMYLMFGPPIHHEGREQGVPPSRSVQPGSRRSVERADFVRCEGVRDLREVAGDPFGVIVGQPRGHESVLNSANLFDHVHEIWATTLRHHALVVPDVGLGFCRRHQPS